ncbi:carbohydrate kinase family protein [Youngiibacter fragilis]
MEKGSFDMYDVVTSGYMSIDRIVKVDSPLKVGRTSIILNSDNTRPYYGGCPINVSYIMAKLGMKPLPILRVGEDNDTLGFLKYLKDANVPLNGLKTIENESSSNCYIVSDRDNNHVTIFYPGAMDAKYASELPDEYFEDTRLALITVGSYNDNREFYSKCQKYDIPIVFGTKLDYDAFPVSFLKEILLSSKIIFSNENEREEINSLLGISEITELFKMGKAELIVTTLGEQGSEFFEKTEGGIIHKNIKVCPAKNFVDATGAGDSYIAGFLYGYLKGYGTEASCQMGSVMASFIIEAVGCTTNAPDLARFNQRLEEYKRNL